MKRLLVLCGLVALLAVPAATAAPLSSPTVGVNPNPVVLDSSFVVSGCGYRPVEQLWVGSLVQGAFAAVDQSGCFSVTWLWQSAWFSPTTQQVQVIVYDAGNGKVKSKALAAVWFWVTPAA